MNPAAPDPGQVLALALASDRGRILAALIARTDDFQLSEDALQQAAESALLHWGRSGVPDSVPGWLIRVAFRKAMDQLRRAARDANQSRALALLAEDEAAPDPQAIPDDRLRLIFTCCHPALDAKSRVALTLRTLCGLGTADIARLFVDSDTTMGQRLSRAKAKIAAARIPFVIPGPEDWPDRLRSVLTVVYLIFTTGYARGALDGQAFATEALYLARLLVQLRPGRARD